jgi:hypothetical protein
MRSPNPLSVTAFTSTPKFPDTGSNAVAVTPSRKAA